ncbi:hypothetical protein PGTUg99_019318 [Puccinia graminis f. sp. tritici]|uniref:Uncharacterized protein n=1 Tax=Puccinia graminis f. sp. tritici TaxID=56615 RepID=A0A5B0SB22_PUCGR|nr:hypothetical protein PGTUg99_019318 [Puccinia graminis f. sp. tritici]
MSDKASNALGGGYNHHRPNSAATNNRQSQHNSGPPTHIPSLPHAVGGTPGHHISRQRDPSGAQAHDGHADTPVFQSHPGGMSGNQSWQPMLAHSGHHPITYTGPPQYMSYSAPMSYMAPTSYQHSAPVYTGQPHYPYSAAPQSHFPPMGQPGPPYYHHPSMPIYAPPPSQHMFFPGHSEPTYWPIQTNVPQPPVNYASRPNRAATSDQPSNTPTPQRPLTSGVDAKASVQASQHRGGHTVGDGSNLGRLEVHDGQIKIDTHESMPKEGSQFDEPGASCADLGWDLGTESANFHELKILPS